jgi:LmbE family N-acetylglucosaminyl deacetylase
MDDEVLGCRGAIARHVEEGHNVVVCVVCNRAYDHVYDAADINAEKQSTKDAQLVR